MSVARTAAGLEEVLERRLDVTASWPVTRLAACSLTLVLAAALYLPAAVHAGGSGWLLLVPQAAVVTAGARALFEVLGFAADAPRPLRHVTTALVPGLAGGALMAAACAIARLRWSLPIGVATAAGATATLAAAGTLRGFEIRLRRGLSHVYFAGRPESLHDLRRELTRHEDRRLVGTATSADVLGEDALPAAVLASGATVLVLDGGAPLPPAAATRLDRAGVGVRDLISYYEQEFKKVPLGGLSAAWFPASAPAGTSRRAYAAWRRVPEAVVAAGLLAAAAPLLLLAALAIRATSPGPVLYRQRRIGRGGTVFTLVKLRTMSVEEPAEAAWASTQAHRVTPLGRHLRRFRIDELPQLWAVLRGDLALIGPRPEQVPIVERLRRDVPHYDARHAIRPGITGWAQVSLGYGGSDEGTLAKLQRDLFYVKHTSLRLDALIAWLTVKAVFAGQG